MSRRSLPDATIRYADHDDAVIDLHFPRDAGGSPADRVVVLLHGGFWKVDYDRRHTRSMARALAEQGWLVVTPEYRRVRGGGGWPTTGEDVHLAVSRLPGLLEGLGLRLGPVTVAGHSAGGHLALWLATTGLPIERVVALAPVCDLREAIRLGLGANATQALLGDVDPDQADPMVLFRRRPSSEITIVHGEEDVDVPISLSRGFVAAHPWVELHDLPGVGHMELIDPGSGPAFHRSIRLVTRGPRQ
ncbi:MAG: alpha/beta hydrolase [Marmoricola sp.]